MEFTMETVVKVILILLSLLIVLALVNIISGGSLTNIEKLVNIGLVYTGP